MSFRARSLATQPSGSAGTGSVEHVPAPASPPATPRPQATPPRRGGALSAAVKDDPVTRRLFIATFVVIALWLATVVGFVSTSSFASNAPRTSAERTMKVYEHEIAARTMTPKKWADYVMLLTSSGQYSRAQETINGLLGQKAVDEKSLIMLEQARLNFARRDFAGAITAADRAIAQAKIDLKTDRKTQADRGFSDTDARLPQEEDAVLLKAEAYQAAGAPKKAIAEFNTYLTYQPTAANVYVERGDMKAAAGDKAGARADYRKALRFTPDDSHALEGLRKIGDES